MGVRPAGIVTFLFTDIAGSTQLWERHPSEMSSALERHDTLCRMWFGRCDGYVFATGGDGFSVAFARASDAVSAATGLQHDLAREPWAGTVRLSVRIALHTGEAVERGGDYFGPTVNTTARLLAVAHGGQILVSDATRHLLADATDLHDLGQHRLRDLTTPMRIWQIGDEQFRPLRTVDAIHGDLPTALSPLLGRDEELATVTRALSDHRLVTLTGVGGVGKTRLAVAAAVEAAPAHLDGCWFVDLSTRETSDDLAAVVSRAIGADATATDRRLLLEHLRERRSLLVLDNCEHLVDHVAELAEDLLRSTKALRLLATSREPLGIDGEHVHRVRSLAVPEPASEPDDIRRSPSVALFVARAQDAGAASDVEHDLAAIAAICRHLDGIPLAIELAAARTRAMSPAEMLARIDERFRLLGGGRRARERHRTLMATVRWSHDLLAPEEQVVWRRLAVFAGGFDIEAAEAVVARPSTIEALLSLVDKSMLQVDTGRGRTRYSMLETLRQFAADRLVDAGEVDEVRARHMAHYLRRVGIRVPLRGPDEHLAWELLVPDRDNVVVAAERLLGGGRPAELVEVLTGAPTFWIVTAPADGLRLLELAVPQVDDDVASPALSLGAFLAWEAGDPQAAVRLGRAHLAACRRTGRPAAGWALVALLVAGNFEPVVGDPDELVEAAELAAELEGADFLRVLVHALVAGYRHRRGDDGWRASFDRAERAAARLASSSAFVTIAVTRATEELRADARAPDHAIAVLRSVEDRVPAASSTVRAWFHVLCGRSYFDVDRPRALDHLREAIRAGDQLGAGVISHIGYEGVALAWADEGRLTDAAILRAVTRWFFDEAGRLRSDVVGEPLRARLDAVLDAGLTPVEAAAAEARARTLSRRALLDLALAGHAQPPPES